MKLIHKEGYRIILTTIVMLLVLNYAIAYFGVEWLNTITLIASIIFFFPNPTVF